MVMVDKIRTPVRMAVDKLEIPVERPVPGHDYLDWTDEQLMVQVQQGHQWALGVLYDRYGRRAYSLAYRMVGNSHGAEDVVQEAFVNVLATSKSGTHWEPRDQGLDGGLVSSLRALL